MFLKEVPLYVLHTPLNLLLINIREISVVWGHELILFPVRNVMDIGHLNGSSVLVCMTLGRPPTGEVAYLLRTLD